MRRILAQDRTITYVSAPTGCAHSRKSTHVGHEPDKKFFDDVAHALAGAREVLIIDHPTDPEVLAYARRHFAAIDR